MTEFQINRSIHVLKQNSRSRAEAFHKKDRLHKVSQYHNSNALINVLDMRIWSCKLLTTSITTQHHVKWVLPPKMKLLDVRMTIVNALNKEQMQCQITLPPCIKHQKADRGLPCRGTLLSSPPHPLSRED